MGKPLAIQGTLCHTPRIGSVDVLKDHLLMVDSSGVISFLGPAGTDAAAAALQQADLQQADVKVLSSSQFLLPGFIDTHCHAPQYAFTGVGTELPLFDWLHTYTFPCEASFSDTARAGHVYRHAVRRLLQLGTTTSNYFITLHVEACKVLVDLVVELGQRAIIGKVCMDINSPDTYKDASAQSGLQGAAEVCAYIQAKGCSRVRASVVPRFIPTCSQQLLEGLGALAQQEGVHVHSHISESREQVEFSRQLHPGLKHDAAVYDAAGLLTKRAMFAHGTQLTVDALQLMAARGAAVAHCPLSNFYFGDGLFCVAQAMAHGVKVGLGTDVAAGYSPSMLQAMRMAIINSHALKAALLMSTERQQQHQQQQQQKQEQQLPRDQQQPQEPGVQPEESEATSQCGRGVGPHLPPSVTRGQPAVQQEDGVILKGRWEQQLPKEVHRPHGSAGGAARPHGAAAGLAGSKVAAAISSPAVSAAALQHQLSWEDALYLATAGGAAALGLGEVVGHFAVGLEFDALLVDCGLPCVFDVLQGQDDTMTLLEHFVHNGDDRNLRVVWVQGKACVPGQGTAWCSREQHTRACQ